MAICRQFASASIAGFFLAAICGIAPGLASHAQTGPAPQPATADKTQRYEVISIKPDRSESGIGRYEFLPVGFNLINLSLRPLIGDAYDVASGDGIIGLPGWVNSEPYDVQAKVDPETAEAWKKLSDRELQKLQQPMLQSLLADRFQLKAHLDSRTGPAYDLVIAKGGLKMKEAPVDEKAGGNLTEGAMTVRAMPLDWLVGNLTGWSGRKVIDKTGLAGKKFDFDLKWTPDAQSNDANAGPSIFAALEEQLGLKLVPSHAPVKTLVIDHIERPSPN